MLIKWMGVINLTPDSFSDTRFALSNSNNKIYLDPNFDIYDLGAESTAPSNKPISLDEEIKRFDINFFKRIDFKSIDPNKIFSIDTYRYETFVYVHNRIKEYGDYEIWWNDISGSFDFSHFDYFKKYQKLKYIYSINRTQIRDVGSLHMSYSFNGNLDDFINDFLSQYNKAVNLFDTLIKANQLIIDPCFGFAKTREQNLYLLNNITKWLSLFDNRIPALIGISKKSFLRNPPGPLIENDQRLESMEKGHLDYLLKISRVRSNLIFRVHDPIIISNFQRLMESN